MQTAKYLNNKSPPVRYDGRNPRTCLNLEVFNYILKPLFQFLVHGNILAGGVEYLVERLDVTKRGAKIFHPGLKRTTINTTTL